MPAKSSCKKSLSETSVRNSSDDLYDQCFPVDVPQSISQKPTRPDPRTIFARVLREIETMELKMRARMDLETVIPRGYVFAIHELESNYVSIGYGGKSHLTSTLRRLQIGNPHKLEVIGILQRYSFDDARELCTLINSGLIMYQTTNKLWFSVDDCNRRVTNMFARIDRCEDEDMPINPPPLVRQNAEMLTFPNSR